MDGVDIGEDLESFVADQVATGRFASSDAVLREGLRLLEAQERKRADIDAAIEIGLAEAAAGRLKPMDDVFDRLEARLRGHKVGG